MIWKNWIKAISYIRWIQQKTDNGSIKFIYKLMYVHRKNILSIYQRTEQQGRDNCKSRYHTLLLKDIEQS